MPELYLYKAAINYKYYSEHLYFLLFIFTLGFCVKENFLFGRS